MERRPGHFCWQGSSGHRMDKPTKDPATVGAVDIEAFSRNLARMVEEGGKALAAYLKPREEGKITGELSDEITDTVKTLGEVAEYWLSDPQPRARSCRPASAAPISICGPAQSSAWPAKQAQPVVTPDPKDKRFADPEWSQNQFFDFLKQAYLLTHAVGRPSGQGCRGRRRAHPPEGRVLRQADRQRDLAVELRADQSGTAARDARLERAKISCAACTCWPRTSRPATAI